MRTLFQDLRYSIRVLRSSPGFTAVAVISLALGIAAITTVFGWIDGILLRPVPGALAPERLVAVETVAPDGSFSQTSYRDYRDYRDNLKFLSGLCGSLSNAFNAGADENPTRIWGELVAGNYFDVLGVKAYRGRTFLPEEAGDQPGAHPVVVIGYRLWQTAFGQDQSIIGHTLRINRHELQIVGVAPPEFTGSQPGILHQVWIPFTMVSELNGQGASMLNDRRARYLMLTGRLRPGARIAQARQEARARARQLAQINPKVNDRFSANVLPIWQARGSSQQVLRAPLQILLAICFVLFLIVCSNVANLQLARATTRHKEFGIRLALGSGSMRIAQQLLTESLVLSTSGALLGVLASMWMSKSLAWMLPPVNVPIKIDMAVNGHILTFAIAMCALAALISGVTPAVKFSRANLNEDLKESGRGSTAGANLHRMRDLLVISEVALAVVALVATGLCAKSFQRAKAIHPGFDPHNVLVAQFYLETFCHSVEDRAAFVQKLHRQLQATPGITGVSEANYIPLGFGDSPWSYAQPEGYAAAMGEDLRVLNSDVAPGYFDVMRIPLVQGRDFTEQDTRQSMPVTIVNETYAKRYLKSQTPIGRKIRVYGKWFTVVGLARDSKYQLPTESATPYLYLPYRQTGGDDFWVGFFLRTAGPPKSMTAAVRRAAMSVNTSAGVFDATALEEWIGASVFQLLLASSLLSVLGVLSLALAAVGLYSVMAYAVSRRTNEIGIRIALGARPRDVLGMVVRQGMLLAAIGLAAGAVFAMVVMHSPFVSAC